MSKITLIEPTDATRTLLDVSGVSVQFTMSEKDQC